MNISFKRQIQYFIKIFFEKTRIVAIYKIFKYHAIFQPAYFINKIVYQNKNIFKTFYIDPNQISKISNYNKKNRLNFGRRISGDWDIVTDSFEDLFTHKGLMQRFEEKYDWEDTIYFNKIIEMIDNKEIPWGCKNQRQLIKRLDNLDLLYKDIKKNGMKENMQGRVNVYNYINKLVKNAGRVYDSYNHVIVDIDRFGNPLFVDGRHRLSIAKILKLRQIPVVVRLRHRLLKGKALERWK